MGDRGSVRGAASALLVVVAFALGACGEDESAGTSAAAKTTPEPGGTLRIAVSGPVEAIDPLLADTRAEQLAARQVFEPPVSNQNGPFGQTRRRPGLVRRIKPRAGGTVWEAELRTGIRFGDGEPFDADALRANAERWMAVAPGPQLVPGLSAVDNPRPGLVRFILDRPSPRFPRLLSQGELGIVAPAALDAAGAAPVRSDGTGTGPFELREQEPARTLLVRNSSWWGTPLGLGPGVDQLELLTVEDTDSRAEDLVAGTVEAADDLDAAMAREIGTDPLLTLVRGGGSSLAVERSVRGIDSADGDQSLADVWLTDLR